MDIIQLLKGASSLSSLSKQFLICIFRMFRIQIIGSIVETVFALCIILDFLVLKERAKHKSDESQKQKQLLRSAFIVNNVHSLLIDLPRSIQHYAFVSE